MLTSRTAAAKQAGPGQNRPGRAAFHVSGQEKEGRTHCFAREPRAPRKPNPFNMDEAVLNYRMMNETIQDVLANRKDNHPEYDAEAGYEIAGFVWFQGYNDQFSPEFRGNYKNNMMTFIKDIRKEYKTPNMPFVIGQNSVM